MCSCQACGSAKHVNHILSLKEDCTNAMPLQIAALCLLAERMMTQCNRLTFGICSNVCVYCS